MQPYFFADLGVFLVDLVTFDGVLDFEGVATDLGVLGFVF